MLLSRVARPLLAAVSVANGVETLMNPKPKIEAVTPLLAKGQGILPRPSAPRWSYKQVLLRRLPLGC